jgi:hypothetical protein
VIRLHQALVPAGRLVLHFFALKTGPLPNSTSEESATEAGSVGMPLRTFHLDAARIGALICSAYTAK